MYVIRAPLPKAMNDNRSDLNTDLLYGDRRIANSNTNNRGKTPASLQGQGVGDVYERNMGGNRTLETGSRLEFEEDFESH